MLGTIIQAFFHALFGTILDGIKSWQRDRDLEQLGYAKAQRDAAVAEIGVVNAVVAAQKRMADTPVSDRAGTSERLLRGEF